MNKNILYFLVGIYIIIALTANLYSLFFEKQLEEVPFILIVSQSIFFIAFCILSFPNKNLKSDKLKKSLLKYATISLVFYALISIIIFIIRYNQHNLFTSAIAVEVNFIIATLNSFVFIGLIFYYFVKGSGK